MPDLVADCYFPGSVKNAERRGHGESDSRKILIKSIRSKMPMWEPKNFQDTKAKTETLFRIKTLNVVLF